MIASGHGFCRQAQGALPDSKLWATFAITAIVMVTGAGGGWATRSLALWADAGHMLFDLLALGIALGAQWVAQKPADKRRAYGYRRLEVLAALVNSMGLVGIAAAIAFQAWQRWANPEAVLATPMMAVATIGLAANVCSLWLLDHHAHNNLNVRSAFLHILGDTLSSVGVIVGGIVILVTGWTRIDAVLSAAIAAIIVASSIQLLRDVVDVLLESAPQNLDTDLVRKTLTSVVGVAQVHDLHVWSITIGIPALSAHVVVTSVRDDPYRLRHTLQQLLQTRFGIHHVTLQMEASVSTICGCV